MCSIEEAFQTIQGIESSPATSRPHERRKDRERRRVKEAFSGSNVRLPPPEPSVIEPDRPAHQRLPPAELLGGGPTENSESNSISQMLNAFDTEQYFPHPHSDNQQEGLYELGQDWTKAFQGDSVPSWIRDRMSQRVAEVPLKPSPWMDGAPTLWKTVPSTMQGDPILKQAEIKTTSQLDTMQQKLDSMFAKLDSLEQTRLETTHIEIILFILGGIFLIFMLDLLVKQGMQASFMMAGAMGTHFIHKGGNLW